MGGEKPTSSMNTNQTTSPKEQKAQAAEQPSKPTAKTPVSKAQEYLRVIDSVTQRREAELSHKLKALPMRREELLTRLAFSVWRSKGKPLNAKQHKQLRQMTEHVEMKCVEVSELLLRLLVGNLDPIDLELCPEDARPEVRARRKAEVTAVNKDIEFADLMKKRVHKVAAFYFPRVRHEEVKVTSSAESASETTGMTDDDQSRPSPKPTSLPQPTNAAAAKTATIHSPKKTARTVQPTSAVAGIHMSDDEDLGRPRFSQRLSDSTCIWQGEIPGISDQGLVVQGLASEHVVVVKGTRTLSDGSVQQFAERLPVPAHAELGRTSARLNKRSNLLEITVPLQEPRTAPTHRPMSEVKRGDAAAAAPRHSRRQHEDDDGDDDDDGELYTRSQMPFGGFPFAQSSFSPFRSFW